MNGSIYTDMRCPVCGGRLKSHEPSGFECLSHPGQVYDSKCRVIFDGRTTRCANYKAAYKVLVRKRGEVDEGTYDVRNYMLKEQPLAFSKLATEWLALKAKQIKPASLRSLKAGMQRAMAAWGNTNIKGIQYAQVEDFINDYPGAPKSRSNALAALKQFWEWVNDRYDIPNLKKWPKLGYVEMAYRQTVDLETQQAIIDDIQGHEAPRVWLCIKWLATYIAIRPGEMLSLTEGEVDRHRGCLVVPHPKEKRAKTIPLIEEDLAILGRLPLVFDRETPFFRHESGPLAGRGFGYLQIYRAWERACKRLGVEGVSLYPGTKHSTACGLREVLTPEQIKALTLHRTSAAFNRYFQTGGNDYRELAGCRQRLANPGKILATKKTG